MKEEEQESGPKERPVLGTEEKWELWKAWGTLPGRWRPGGVPARRMEAWYSTCRLRVIWTEGIYLILLCFRVLAIVFVTVLAMIVK